MVIIFVVYENHEIKVFKTEKQSVKINEKNREEEFFIKNIVSNQ